VSEIIVNLIVNGQPNEPHTMRTLAPQSIADCRATADLLDTGVSLAARLLQL
jgi:hypothetical protein